MRRSKFIDDILKRNSLLQSNKPQKRKSKLEETYDRRLVNGKEDKIVVGILESNMQLYFKNIFLF